MAEKKVRTKRKTTIFIFILVGLTGVIELIICEPAFAWGPGVHTVIALRSLDAAANLFSIIGQIIISNPLEYLYGSLAADFFLMKARLKPSRHAHHWKGGFALLNEAKTNKEKAYAYGFLAHLVADVIAHNIFIPNLLNIFSNKRGRAHLYWEIRADYVVGPIYTRIARSVLSTEQQDCDNILRSVINARAMGLSARKKIYAQSVKISDYLYGTMPSLFDRNTLGWKTFKEYSLSMVMVSSFFVSEFLRDPYNSVCLRYDPNGKVRLHSLKRKGLLARVLRLRRANFSEGEGCEIYHI